MKTDNNLAAKSGEAKQTRVEKAIRLLTTLAGNPFNQKLEEFKAFYPAVNAAKRNGMKNKQIIKILAEAGLKLYPALFEKLMTAMARDPSENTCGLCGEPVSRHIGEPDVASPVETGLNESRACFVEGA
jgi:hypothetical protein